MTRSISDEIRRLGDKNKRLLDIVQNVARVNVGLLYLSICAENHPNAKLELDKLACLVNAIQFELRTEGIKFYIGPETTCELPEPEDDGIEDEHEQSLNNVPQGKHQKEDDDFIVKVNNTEETEWNDQDSLQVKISPSNGSRKGKSRASLDEEEVPTNKRKGKGMDFPWDKGDISVVYSPSPVESKLLAQDILSTIEQHETILNDTIPLSRKKKKSNEKTRLTTHFNPRVGPCMCEICGKMLKSKDSLRSHIKLHKEKDANLSFSCSICGKLFNLKKTLHSHMKFHSSERQFQCTFCGKCFLKHNILNLHLRTHTGEKPYICNVCNKSFSLSSNLRRHEKIHTGDKPWKCVHCGKSFNQSSILKSHLRTHSQEKLFKCTLCDKSFSQSKHLYSHSIRMHSKDIRQHPTTKIYKCTVCERQFLYRNELTFHIRTHTGDRPFQCSYCLKRYSTKMQLDNHIRIHTGYKPYKCSQCDKTFTRSTSLFFHTRIHEGNDGKVFTCPVCSKSFNNYANMMRHKRNHSGEKAFKCEVCSRAFSQKVSLELHMWTHSSEKKYKCSICGKGYNDKRNLNSHSKIHTSSITQPTSIPPLPLLPPPQAYSTAQKVSPVYVSMPNNFSVITCQQITAQNSMSLTSQDGSIILGDHTIS